MSDDKPARNLTNEVQEALRQRGHVIPGEGKLAEEPKPPKVPEGHRRYHIAVEGTVFAGTAPVATIAAQLRGLADQIEKEQSDGKE